MYTKEKLEKEIYSIDRQIAQMCFSQSKDSEGYKKLRDKLNELREEYRFLSLIKVASNDEIDIYVSPTERYIKNYIITLSGISQQIGLIQVIYEQEKQTKYGNVGYEIKRRYRGHHLTLKALELLSETLIENGMEKPIFAIRENNIASIKTIEKFGGCLIHKAQNDCDCNIYEVDLIKKKSGKVKRK